ncbi:MAG: metal-dependent hydrolase [Deltaproteobacteria bacterium]|nr:metal-dependent hydrolase [Deltaproteobacteria bacterium]
MLGNSHRLMAASGAVLLGASPLQAAVAALGATLPDRIEIVGLPHRGISHWPWPWALAVWSMHAQHSEWGTLLAWWLAGALLHIGADLFTVGGVPLVLPNWRVRLGILRTGGLGEYVLVVLFVVVALMQVFHLQMVRVGVP